MSTERVAPTAIGEVLIPALFALFMNLAAVPLWYVLFSGSEERGAGTPWPAALALFALAAYALTRIVGVGGYSLGVHVVGWLAGLALWALLEPTFGLVNDVGRVTLGGVLRTLVLVWWSATAWWVGVRYATHLSFLRPGAIRMMATWGWRVLVGGVVIAALIDDDGARALEHAIWVVPAAMFTWVALIALGEIHRSGLDLRHKVGTVSPLRHWLSAVGLTIVAVLGISAAAVALLPSVAGGLGVTAVGRGLAWILNGVYRVLGPVVVFIGDLLLSLVQNPGATTSVNFGEGETSQVEVDGISVTGDTTSMVWIVVGVVAVCLVIFVLVWARRRVSTVTVEGTEIDRVNLFETGLVGGQILSTFRRRRWKRRAQARQVDLSKPPTNVREAWTHLETLAAIRGVSRTPVKTVRDFATGLTVRWPDAEVDITHLSRLYERVQYGDEPGNNREAIRTWHAIQPVLSEQGNER